MVTEAERREILEYVQEALSAGISERGLCKLLFISPKTLQNWRNTGVKDKRKGSLKKVRNKLTEKEENAFFELSNSPQYVDKTPEQIVASLLDIGIYYGSASTLYRILRSKKALHHRQESKKPVKNSKATLIEVTGPNQVWAWDITWLKTDIKGMFKYAYTIIDLYSRDIVGWSVEDYESEEFSIRLFERIMRKQKVVPKLIHADNGGPMRGASLGAFLDSLCISRSHSRPRCSNDNAFIESWHKTLKYTVGYPKFFTSITHARTWYAKFINWYNNEHLHSSLGYVTPAQRRKGEAMEIYAKRHETLLIAKSINPHRWINGTVRRYAPKSVTINARILSNVA
ncbi:hypothetical protein MASR2M29_23680 [Spirochaetota bacterium]